MIRNDAIREEGVLYAGQWEPIYFLKQSGNNRENLQSAYDFQRSEPYVRHLAAIGANQVWTNFFKGYGLEFEDAEQQRLRAFAELCHAHHIRVLAYATFGTLVLETLLAEEPDAESWLAKPDVLHRAAYWGYQSFRARVCYSSDAYVDYLVRVVDKAIDLGADGIHFDNAEMSIGLEACRCERCQRKFRTWLDQRYGDHSDDTRRAGRLRYGTNDFSRTETPWFTLGQHPVQQREIKTPCHQDWIQFRCDTFAAAARRLAEHIRARGKLVEFNFGKNDNANNQYYRGVDYERLYPLVDLSFHEGVTKLGFNRHGSPVCAIRAFKIAAAFGIPLMVYCKTVLEQAVAFALNPGMIGTLHLDGDPARRRMFDFFRKYKRYNTHTESLARVAVLRHRLSMAYDSYPPTLAASAVEQLLQESHVPFDILAASHLGRLRACRLLIIPAMRVITDAEIETVSAWVRAGGRLLLIGQVATKNELGQVRSAVKEVKSIEDLKAAREVRPGFSELVGRAFGEPFVVDAGEGQVGSIPDLEHVDVPGTDVADWTVTRDHVNVPANGADLLETIRRLLAGEERLRVDAPRDVLAEFRRRADTGESVIHLVNLGHADGRSASAEVAFRWDGPVGAVRCLRYDEDEVELAVTKDGAWHTVRVEAIREHAVLIIA